MVGAVSGPERQIRAPKREHVPLFLYETFLIYGSIWFPFDLVVGDGWCRLGPRKADSKVRFGPRKGNTCHSHLAFLGSCLYTCSQLCPTLPVLFSYVFVLFSYDFLCFSFMLSYASPLYFCLTGSLPFPLRSFPNVWLPFGLVGGDGWCGLGPRKVGWKADSGPERGIAI